MANLAKTLKNSGLKAKHIAKLVGGSGGKGSGSKADDTALGGLGYEIVKVGVMTTLSVATKHLKTVGPIPASPDVLGTVAGLGMALIGKGKTRRLGRAIAVGGVNACIARAVWGGQGFEIVYNEQGQVSGVREVPADAVSSRATGGASRPRATVDADAVAA